MKKIFTLVLLVLSIATGIAQEPDMPDVDSTAMRVLAEYSSVIPIRHFHGNSARHISLRLRIAHSAIAPLGVEPKLWEESKQIPRIIIQVPKYRGYDSSVWRIRHNNASLVISNGSAYNYMLWPNDPGAYRDARTLSFPLPR